MQLDRRGFLTCSASLLLGGMGMSLALAQTQPGGHAPGQAGKPQSPGPKGGGASTLKLEVKTDRKQYGVKDSIPMTLTAKNTTGETVSLPFSSSQKFDFEIKRGKEEKGETLWKWSRGMMFAQMMSSAKVEPGKSLTYSATYKPGATSGDGKTLLPLAPGTYTVVATLMTAGSAPKPKTTTTFMVK